MKDFIANILKKKLSEAIELPVEVGDTVLMGKFKNKKIVVKDIDWDDEKGDLKINGKPALKFRLSKKDDLKEALNVSENTTKKTLTYRFEHLDSYDGQDNWELGLYIPEGIVGLVQYVTFEGEITISDILVRPEYRRKGLASRMIKAVKNKHPELKYRPSMKTDLGAKFKHKDIEDMDVMDEGLIGEDYFDTTIDDDIKGYSNRYVGRGVTWYGSPDQMVVVHKDYVDFTPENQFNRDKLEYLTDLIINHDDNVEIECSWGTATLTTFQDILEEQQSVVSGDFELNYNGTTSAASIGDDELDNYIGSEELHDSELMEYESYDNPDLYDLLNNNRFFLMKGGKKEDIIELVNDLNEESKEEIGEPLSEDDYEFFNRFIEIEERIFELAQSGYSDIGDLRVTLGDGNHRVTAAIDAGENYICLNLEMDDIKKYGDKIKELDYINRVR